MKSYACTCDKPPGHQRANGGVGDATLLLITHDYFFAARFERFWQTIENVFVRITPVATSLPFPSSQNH
jgi:hypothetical protein